LRISDLDCLKKTVDQKDWKFKIKRSSLKTVAGFKVSVFYKYDKFSVKWRRNYFHIISEN